MTGTAAQRVTTDLFAALLRGETIPWTAFELPVTKFLRMCNEESVTGLI